MGLTAQESSGEEEPSRGLGILRSGEETRRRQMVGRDITVTGNEGRFHVLGDLKTLRTEGLWGDEPEK